MVCFAGWGTVSQPSQQSDRAVGVEPTLAIRCSFLLPGRDLHPLRVTQACRPPCLLCVASAERPLCARPLSFCGLGTWMCQQRSW